GSDFSDPSLAIIESLTMAAAYVDASGTIQCVNSAYAQTCGIRRDEFVGRHFEEMLSRWVGNEFYQTAVLSFREALNGHASALHLEGPGNVFSRCVFHAPDSSPTGTIRGAFQLIAGVTPNGAHAQLHERILEAAPVGI